MTNYFRKSLAVVIALALLITCLIVPTTVGATGEELDIWEGGEVAPSMNGDGVYEISTPEELAFVVKNGGGASYILTKDIYLNNPEAVNWATGQVNDGFEPEEWYEGYSNPFTGTLDGNGHVIHGLYYPSGNNWGASTNVPVGLFPTIGAGVTIKNLGIQDSYLYTVGFAGAFVGFFKNIADADLLIDNCFSDRTVTVEATAPSSEASSFAAGGIIGCFNNSGGVTVTNCYSSANTIDNKDHARNAKILGDAWSDSTKYINTMKNCYAVGGGATRTGQYTAFSNMENVYSTATPGATYGIWTQVSEENMTGGAAAANMPNLGDAFYVTNGTPALKVFNKDLDTTVWGGFRDSDLEGNGTDADPYKVYTGEELAYAVNSGLDKVFQLQNDIILNDSTVKLDDGVGVIYDAESDNQIEDTSMLIPWTSGKFPGTIDGNGNIVRGMYFSGTGTSSAWNGSVFAFIKTPDGDTAIKNLGIEDSYVKHTGGVATGFIGILQTVKSSGSGYDFHSPTVTNSYLGDSVYLEGDNASGIFGGGSMQGLGANAILNCYVTATINATNSARSGAIAAETWSPSAFRCTNFYTTYNKTYNGIAPGSLTADGNLATYGVRAFFGVSNTEKNYIGSFTDGSVMPLSDAFYAVNGDLPKLKSFSDDKIAWGGFLASGYAGGEGTEADPFEISTPEQLAYMLYTAVEGKYYELVNDIVITEKDAVNWENGTLKEGLSYTPSQWFYGTSTDASTNNYRGQYNQNKIFKGHLNGNGFTVSGVYYQPHYDNDNISWPATAGLIPVAHNGTISNLVLANSHIDSVKYSGGIVGYSNNETFENILVANTVTVKQSKYQAAGGFVGYANGSITMTNCGNNATVDSPSGHENGLIGTYWGTAITITNSYSVGVKAITAKNGSDANATFTLTNVYSDKSVNRFGGAATHDAVQILDTDKITGKNALDNMTGFSEDLWYGVTGQGPFFRAYGARILDTNCDGMSDKVTDAEAIRVGIITNVEAPFANMNDDAVVDICDLVAFVAR